MSKPSTRMSIDEDVRLFATLQFAERQSLLPARNSTLSEAMAASSDPHTRSMATQAELASGSEEDVPFLLSMLSSGDAAVLEASIDGLWKLAINGRVRAAVNKVNGARPLVALLAHKQPRVVRVAAGCLSILALDSAQRTTIIASGGAAALSAVLADGGDREAEQAARATANLAA